MRSYIEGFTACMKRLESLEKTLDDTILTPEKKKAMEAIADVGWATWNTALAQLPPLDDGTNDTKLETPSWEGRELVIRAHGSNAYFVEFGTGVHKNYSTQYGQQYGFYPTSWSSTMGSGWLTGSKRQKFRGWWILPKGIVPEDTKGAQYTKTVTRTWMTKKYGLRKRTYFYRRSTPFCYWAEGHAPVNGMYKAMRRMQMNDMKQLFKVELLK